MKINVMILLVLIIGLTGNAFCAEITQAPTQDSSSAGLVLSQFFEFLQNGQASEAQELFLARNPEQISSSSNVIKGGIQFFAQNIINNLVVETFVNGPCSICAVEQSSPDHPGKKELEKSFLILNDGRWKLLPQPQDYRASLNGLTPEKLNAFDLLQKEFSIFKSEWSKN